MVRAVIITLITASIITTSSALADGPQRDGPFVSAADQYTPLPPIEQMEPRSEGDIIRATAGSCLEVPVLVMVYRNYTYDTVTDQELAKLMEEVAEAETFYWRNSYMRFDPAIDYMIIDRTLTLDQFWEVWDGAYWYPWWAVDGQHSVQHDLIDNGVQQGDYAAVFVFYAWENNEYGSAAYGGGTYGVDFGPFADCAYCAVPLCWDPESNDWLFIHEFHHAFDSMWHFSGHPEYPHADRPQDYDYPYNDGYEFNAWMLWDCDYYDEMSPKYGHMIGYTDTDSDGVPDSGARFTITEATMGTDIDEWDTDHDGRGDLWEAAAHWLMGSDPLDRHTDIDGRADGVDPYPLDPCPEYVTPTTPTVDAYINAGEYDFFSELHTDNDNDLSATLYFSWNADGLNVAVDVTDDMVECPWSEPWWDDHLLVQIDVNNDGFVWKGIDNYELYIAPTGVGGNPLIDVRIKTPDGDRFDLVSNADITAKYRKLTRRYIIEARIPRNTQTGLLPSDGDVMGCEFSLGDYDTYPGWPRFPFFTQFVDLTLIDGVETATAPVGWLNPGWNWFSIPLDPVEPPEASAVLGCDATNILYWWDPGAKTVKLYPDDFTILERGHGYVLWLTKTIAPSYEAYPRAGAFEVPIPEAGWTWIGQPMPADTLQAHLTVRNELTGGVRTPVQDSGAPDPWLNWNFLYWQSDRDTVMICYFGGADDDTLRPWRAYRVWANAEDLKIIIP